MNFNSNPILYPKDDGLKPTKDNGNPPCYPKEDGLNPFKAIVERINALESVTRNYGDSFETKQLTVSENAQIEKLNATEGTVTTLNSTTADIKNAQIENLRTNRLTWDLPSIDVENVETIKLHATEEIKAENLKTEEPILSNAVVGYDENGKMIPIKLDNTVTIDYIYPVGTLYWTGNQNFDPNVSFGGTWVQIKDRFVLACGDTYKTVDETGGASSVTLSVSNMPSHNHSFTPSGSVSSHSHGLNNHTHSFSGTTGGMSKNSTGAWHSRGLKEPENVTVSGNISKYNGYGVGDQHPNSKIVCTGFSIDVSHTHSFSGTTDGNSGNTASATPTFTGNAGTTSSEGSGTSFSILPPYVVKYCWERTA